MNEIYKTLAEGYEKLAAGYRALAKDQKDEKVEMAVPAEPEKKKIPLKKCGQFWQPRHRPESAGK